MKNTHRLSQAKCGSHTLTRRQSHIHTPIVPTQLNCSGAGQGPVKTRKQVWTRYGTTEQQSRGGKRLQGTELFIVVLVQLFLALKVTEGGERGRVSGLVMVPLSRRLERAHYQKQLSALLTVSTERRTAGRRKGKGRNEGGMVESRRERRQGQ